MLVILLMALAFLSLVATAATHIHATEQATHGCSICSLAPDQVGGHVRLPTLAVAQFFILFTLAVPALTSALFLPSLIRPHSCGPPGRD